MNLEVLKNDVRDRLVDGLIVGGNAVRWALHQLETPPPQAASIQYYQTKPAPDNMDRRLIA